MDLKSKIILIAGPTASGKTKFSVQLAKKIKGEIINADSMQVYKELKILTSRPTAKDKKFRGWLDLDQSYFNMEEEWWLPKFKKYYENVYVIESFWNDSISNGRWFICF